MPQSPFKIPVWAGATEASPPAEKRVTTPDGTVHVFPSSVSDDRINEILGTGRTLGGDLWDVGAGYVKGAGRLAMDMMKTGMPNTPAAVAPTSSSIPALGPTNARQQSGMFGFDVASTMLPGYEAGAGAQIARPLALKLAKRIFPEPVAKDLLANGAIRISESSAKKMEQLAKATPKITETPKWIPEVKKGPAARFGRGEWGYTTTKGPSKHQPSADAMRAATDMPASLSVQDLLAMTGRGAIGTVLTPANPALGAAVGASLQLRKMPRAVSTASHLLQQYAPAIGGAQGVTGASLAMALRSLFGGSEPE